MTSRLPEPPVVHGSQRPRICLVPPAEITATGEAALEVCELAGLHLDPWQRWVLAGSLGERADGKWAAFEVAEVIPRQNGKGSVLEGRELTGLFVIDEERLIIHSAHEQATSSEHQLRLLQLIESVPEFDRKVQRVVKGKGQEAIELRDGSRVLFKTRTGGGGRGLTGDLIVLDEAMILPEATTAALVPTMAARSMIGNPQLWYAGSAVDQEKTDHGIVLARVRERGIKGTARLMYVEWSADVTNPVNPDEPPDPSNIPDEVLNDPAIWAQANPGLGVRISLEHISNEVAALGPRGFAVERLGIGDWPRTDGLEKQVITTEAWVARVDRSLAMEGRPCFCFDVTPDRSTAAIGAAGFRPDGKPMVETLEHRPGTGWVAARLAELKKKHRPIAIIADGSGPAASLLSDLADLNIQVELISAKEHAQACGLLFDEVDQGVLCHGGTPELAAAIAGAAQRPLGEAWAWSRKSSAVDISPLVAVTLANWGSHTKRSRKRTRVVSLADALAAEQAASETT